MKIFPLLLALMSSAQDVETLDFPDLTDGNRDGRSVPLRVHFPREKGRFPLVVFSHGGMGNRESHETHAKHVARHGYVAVCIEHVYSNTRRTIPTMNGATIQPRMPPNTPVATVPALVR